ncbi:hypothetical protein CGCSCA4_v011846 [Colletotrichum siamense]|uniref:Uncharacterized protein n=1 Tax=Colletotrichum siamense TaxID=690259 RepID=A0A9P5BQP0_COLSI|nr:hypothetical protein CGCSCA4_v011846 [Colletotrichum siamense]KAF4848837.1 hypothetical protein CGCSCA2_v012095 [Colletotrichum siamense]
MGFMYMSFVEGDTLEERWSEVAEDERLDVCKEPRAMVDAWSAWGQDQSERYIGSHLKQPSNDIMLRDCPEKAGSFENPNTLKKFHSTCGIGINDKKRRRVHACRSSPVKYSADTRATPESCSHYRLGTSGMVPRILGILQSQANESDPGASAYRMG